MGLNNRYKKMMIIGDSGGNDGYTFFRGTDDNLPYFKSDRVQCDGLHYNNNDFFYFFAFKP
jgi:hypothetical protein